MGVACQGRRQPFVRGCSAAVAVAGVGVGVGAGVGGVTSRWAIAQRTPDNLRGTAGDRDPPSSVTRGRGGGGGLGGEKNAHPNPIHP
ncbi:hypothetical protein NHX12_025618 [Muraenolepis orangiensis]|uniref:Uncharacterized protein n=1 Tax=Muraenolepis orangiensis TaxID=630683 RepID=A0A9Q0EKW4_9TELE|nr:hypothetical protein NHX12_025618 [Muraenolepis orangiensis]